MIYFKITKRFAKRIGVTPVEVEEMPTSTLGNWYARDVPTSTGDLIQFHNEKTYLTIILVAQREMDLKREFIIRFVNLMAMLGFPEEIVAEELVAMETIHYAKATDRRILGSMNDVANYLQIINDDPDVQKPISTSFVELHLADWLFGAIKYEKPRKIAERLLNYAPHNEAL